MIDCRQTASDDANGECGLTIQILTESALLVTWPCRRLSGCRFSLTGKKRAFGGSFIRYAIEILLPVERPVVVRGAFHLAAV